MLLAAGMLGLGLGSEPRTSPSPADRQGEHRHRRAAAAHRRERKTAAVRVSPARRQPSLSPVSASVPFGTRGNFRLRRTNAVS